jgi:hypothetical protein
LGTNIVPYIEALPADKIKTIEVDLTALIEGGENLIAQAERAEVTDEKSYASGGDLIKIARTQAKKADEMRTELVGPYNKLIKFVNGAFRLPKEKFTDARSIIEKKMMVWKRAEDERLRKEAEAERKRLEDEALARAALEKSEEGQEEVLDAAAEAGEQVVEDAGVKLQRGDYGSSTGTKKVYTTNVESVLDFVDSLLHLAKNGEVEISTIIEFKKSGLNKLAQYMLTERSKNRRDNIPGARFTESENIRVY